MAARQGLAGQSGRRVARRRPLAPGRRSELAVKVEARDAGRYLAQFGYPDAVRRGQATLSGQFDWQGAPRRSTIRVCRGASISRPATPVQQAGTRVGRLLGVLSLQSLPRRITLGFP